MSYCDHMVSRRDGTPHPCGNKARFHYRSTTGIVVKLCGQHAGAEAHRWKNPRPITDVLP